MELAMESLMILFANLILAFTLAYSNFSSLMKALPIAQHMLARRLFEEVKMGLSDAYVHGEARIGVFAPYPARLVIRLYPSGRASLLLISSSNIVTLDTYVPFTVKRPLSLSVGLHTGLNSLVIINEANSFKVMRDA